MTNSTIDTETLTQEWLNAGYEAENFAQLLNTMPSPQEYIDAGIGPDTHLQWEKVGGFDIEGMKALIATFTLDELATETTEGYGGYSASVAYRYCNRDLSLQEIEEILGSK